MSKPVDIDEKSFKEKVIDSKTPVLVDFWAPWCRPCLMVAPIVDELAEEYSDRVSFTRMNVDQNQQVAAQYNIMSIPTLIVFKGGKPVSHIVGFRPKEELKQNLEAAISA